MANKIQSIFTVTSDTQTGALAVLHPAVTMTFKSPSAHASFEVSDATDLPAAVEQARFLHKALGSLIRQYEKGAFGKVATPAAAPAPEPAAETASAGVEMGSAPAVEQHVSEIVDSIIEPETAPVAPVAETVSGPIVID